jgi:hypothetical protein
LRRAAAAVIIGALGAGALALGCTSVDLGDPPADVNACRPSQAFFVDEIWPNFLDKDYGGRRCADGACHGPAAGRPLTLLIPEVVATTPLTMNWAANYRSATENMQCSQVDSSALLRNPSGQVTHGGGKLIEPNGPEATLLEMWVIAP